MAEARRRLTTIVAADIAGFSRLVGIDEEATLAAQRGHRTELIEPLLAEYHGRIANTAGDSFLFEFPSAVEAVRCAIAVQNGMAERNQDIPQDNRIEYRFGINVGDVVSDGEDLLGDGVNIAARLENICEPGGIILSDDAYRQVRDRLDIVWEDQGEHEVKNIVRPVQVWSWASKTRSNASVSDISKDNPLPLPDKPSIAVLPFDNMSGDPEQEYFSDGITEDIITSLSRFHQFVVIARNSSFTYKGSAVDVRQVAQDLGVKYIIEGSVRRAGNRVRITAQLIDGATDHHIWAERYDRELNDIFAIQDDITERISVAVAPELQAVEVERARRKSLPELGVWELIARATWHSWKITESDNATAESLLEKALDMDPDNAAGYSAMAFCYGWDGLYGWQRPRPQSYTMATEMAQKAVSIDKRDENALWILGAINLTGKQHQEAISRLQAALEINPNCSPASAYLGMTYLYLHRHDEALDLLWKAIRLSPKDPLLPLYLAHIGMHYFVEKRYDDMLTWAAKALRENPNFPSALRMSAVGHGLLGNPVEARAAYEHLDKIIPGVTIAATLQVMPFAFQPDADLYAEGLRKAGMPEE